MASNVGTMLTVLLDDSQKPGKSTQLTRSLVRALDHYAGSRTWFTQKNATISLTAGTNEYQLATTVAPAVTGLLPDFMGMDDIRWSDSAGSRFVPVEKVTPAAMRDLQYFPAARGIPRQWTIHHGKLILWPTPNTTGDLLQCWYQFDATLNSADGAVIDGATSTHTNPWFYEGESSLRTWALFDFFMTYVKDQETAQLYAAMNAAADASIETINANYQRPGRVRAYW